MSAMSPGFSLRKEQSSTSIKTLHTPEVTQALETFLLLLKSCYGPSGSLKTLQNSCGGSVTITSSSSVLVKQLSVSQPSLQLMLATVESHIADCCDGGLFCALLMAELVKSCSSLDLHPVLCININEVMLKLCLEFLNNGDACVDIDIGDAQMMLSLVRSIVSTKPACVLMARETDFICSLILQAFLRALPDSGQFLQIPKVEYVHVEGKTPMDSEIVDGILIESPQIATYSTKNLKLLRQDDKRIKVALYNTSLAGGGEGFPDIRIETQDGVSLDDASLKQLLALGRFLVQQKIGLLACQKVVHPSLKQFLRTHDVLTIDRLSLVHIDAVRMLTGARLLGDHQASILDDAIGFLTDLSHCVLHGKSYLHLMNPGHPVCTFVLCNRTASSLEELKTVCSSANHVLGLTLTKPLAVPGAGCFETQLAAHLRHKVEAVRSDILDDIGCSASQFMTASNNFINCVVSVARALEHGQNSHLTDAVHHHRWPLPPGCESPCDWLRYCACGMKLYKADSDWFLLGCMDKVSVGIHQSSEQTEQSDLGQQMNETDDYKRLGVVLENEKSQETLVLDTRSILVLDSYIVKRNALQVAVDTANVILRVHRTIEGTSS